MNHYAKLRALAGAFAGFAAVVVLSLATAAPAQAQDVRITGVTCAGTWNWDGTNRVLSCTPTPTGQNPQLANCKFTSNPAPTAGIAFGLTVACDNLPASASFTWSATPPSGCSGTACTPVFASGSTTTTPSNTVTLPAAGTWSVAASVAAANGSGTATWSGTVAPPAPVTTGNSYSCGAAFTSTKTMTLPAWTIGASANHHLYTADAGHLGPQDAIVVEVATPAVLGNETFGAIAWSDIGSDPIAKRVVVLSDVACDFTKGVGGNPLAIANGVANGSIYFFAGTTGSGYPALSIPNHKYFLNIRNVDCVSGTGHCDLDLEFQNPK